jgi:hypothetical protein
VVYGGPRAAEGDLRAGGQEILFGDPGSRAVSGSAPESPAREKHEDRGRRRGIFALWAAPSGGVAPPAGGGSGPAVPGAAAATLAR